MVYHHRAPKSHPRTNGRVLPGKYALGVSQGARVKVSRDLVRQDERHVRGGQTKIEPTHAMLTPTGLECESPRSRVLRCARCDNSRVLLRTTDLLHAWRMAVYARRVTCPLMHQSAESKIVIMYRRLLPVLLLCVEHER